MKTLQVELHCHTIYSHDGHIGFDALLKAARNRLDVICITDHDTVDGAREFKRRCAELNCDLQIMIGEERTLADGSHLIGLFLKEAISSVSFEEAVEEISEQGGICILPHPYRRKDGVLRGESRSLQGISAFELFNPKCSFEENQRAAELATCGLHAVGGSDAHYAGDLGECVNVVPFIDSPVASVERFLRTHVPYTVIGTPQGPSDQGRKYAPTYYRLKPYLQLPRPLIPVARVIYGVYRNNFSGRKPKRLETKYVYE